MFVLQKHSALENNGLLPHPIRLLARKLYEQKSIFKIARQHFGHACNKSHNIFSYATSERKGILLHSTYILVVFNYNIITSRVSLIEDNIIDHVHLPESNFLLLRNSRVKNEYLECFGTNSMYLSCLISNSTRPSYIRD